VTPRRRVRRIAHEFVELVPDELDADTLYISIEYTTAVHDCLCGCGNRVVTPLSPTDWQLVYDGETVSLTRSVGNWSFPCQSHYWIERDRVHWHGAWSKEKIEANRAKDRGAKDRYYRAISSTEGAIRASDESDGWAEPPAGASAPAAPKGFWRGLTRRLSRR
jgi:hypothetical protein